MDYRFLGAAPDAVWWSDFRGLTEFEGPSLILLGDGLSWRLIASAIPSSRRDSEGSAVRFTLAAEGTCDIDDPDLALRLVSCWLADAGRPANESALGQKLDQVLTDDYVDTAYDDAEAGDGFDHDVQSRLEKVVANLPRPIAGSHSEVERWYASLESTDSHAPFVGRCRDVLMGTSALACALNSAAAGQLSELGRSGTVAVLLPDGPEQPQPIPPSTDLIERGPVAPGKASGRGRSRMAKLLATPRRRLTLAAVPVTIVLLAILAWVLL